MKEKKICLFIGSLRGGGAEKVCVNLANSLQKIGYNVTLCVMNLNNATYTEMLSKEIKLVNLNVDHTRNSFYKLYCFLKKEKPKVLLSFNYQISIVLLIIRNLTNLKYAIISRNIILISEAQKDKSSFWQRVIVYKILKVLYKKMDFVISQSEEMKNDLIKNFQIPDSKIKVINNPVAENFEDVDENLIKNPVRKTKRLLFVGRLTRQKGLDYLISSFSKVIEKDAEVTLKLVGEGPLKSELENDIREKQLQSNIFFSDFTDRIIEEYLKSDIVVLSSRYEGFPNVLIEAISLGIPVVSFNSPSGPKEIIKEGENGYLAEYKDVDDLANKILLGLRTDWSHDKIFESSKRYRTSKITSEYNEVIKLFL